MKNKIPINVNQTKKYLLIKEGKILDRFRLRSTANEWQGKYPNSKIMTLNQYKEMKNEK